MSSQEEYLQRINKTLDFIEQNMKKSFTLEDLADVACFSKFHFTRIFYAFVKETPFQFITRIRLEKSAYLMVSNPKKTISEIAQYCGYEDLALFSRNFKKYFKVSPTKYRSQNNSNNIQMESNKMQTGGFKPNYFYDVIHQNKNLIAIKMKNNKKVEVKVMPEMTVAYIRHIGPYAGDEKLFEGLWHKLFGWAGARGLLDKGDFQSLVIYHDDPNLTREDKLRMSVCITVPPETKVEGEIGKMTIEQAKYGIARFEVDATEFAQAWQWVYSEWLPYSGFQPDDKPCFEMYPEEPKDGKFKVDICIPVKPL